MAKKKKQDAVQDNPMSAALDSMSSIYNSAKSAAKSFSGEKVPEGKYELRLSGIKLREKEKDGVLSISLQRSFTVLSGDNEGMTQTDFMKLTNETGLSFAMQFITTMGYEIPDTPADWPEVVEELQEEAPACIGEIVHSGDFVNVRITELLDDEDLDDEEYEDEDSEEEDDSEEDSDEEEEEDEEDEDELREELSELSRKELKAIIKEEDIDFKVTKSKTEEDIIDAIVEDRLG